MKRIVAFVLVLCMAVSFSGCAILDYNQAMEYYEAGDYAAALEIYKSLGDFADSAAMAEICWQKADYKQAEELFAAGDYQQALPLYEGLAMYMDAPVKAIVCQYRIGSALLEEGNYEEGIQWLLPLGSYEDCLEQIRLAKWNWMHTAVKQSAPFMEINGGTVTLNARADGSFAVSFFAIDSLLGISYQKKILLTFNNESNQGTYEAVYDSASSGQVKEEASGIFDIAQFSAATKLPVSNFTQTIVDPDGKETISNTPSDSLMMAGVLPELTAVIAQSLPQLLGQTGVPVTPAELGLTSLD